MGVRRSVTKIHNLKTIRTIPPVLPFLAHVWNNTPDVDTNVTPFEAKHDMSMRSIEEILSQNPPAEGLSADVQDLNTISQSCVIYIELIVSIKAVEANNLRDTSRLPTR